MAITLQAETRAGGMEKFIELATIQCEELIDITAQVAEVLRESGVRDGMINV